MHMLGEGQHESQTGTSVYRGFVELPVLMENWLPEKEFSTWGRVHYETGEPIPADLVDSIAAAQNYRLLTARPPLSFGLTPEIHGMATRSRSLRRRRWSS